MKRNSKKLKRLPSGISNPIDQHVGSRLRLVRSVKGISQEKLGNAVGLTFQQIQKYERGANRIGASRLYEFSQYLEIHISFFFDDMPTELQTHEERLATAHRQTHASQNINNQFVSQEAIALVRAYYGIPDTKLRKRLFEMIKTIAGNETE